MTQPHLFDPQTIPTRSVQTEPHRLHAACLRVLAHLQQHGSATNVELSQPEVGGLRGVGRVFELKRAGYPITKKHEHGGIWRYTLEAK